MSESSPEVQLNLPIFKEETAWYEIGGPTVYGAEHNATAETVHVPVDEIDLMPDPRMREALWAQFRLRKSKEPKTAMIVIANPDKTHFVTNIVRRGGPTFIFAPSDYSEVGPDVNAAFPKLVIEKKTAARRIIERIFG